MKKCFVVVIFCMIFLCSCGKKHPDYIASNTGSGWIFSPIITSGNGYYYNDFSSSKMSLKYFDSTKNETVYLCSRPECTHDGNEFCNATSEKYTYLGMSEYEDKIYIEAGEYDETKAEVVFKLLRAEKDGSELSEVASFGKQKYWEGIWPVAGKVTDNPVIHRGKAYLPYILSGDENMVRWSIAEIDIYKGSVKTIFKEDSNGYLSNICADGENLFFTLFNYKDKNYEYVLYHYDIKKGKIESLSCPQKFLNKGAAMNGKYYYPALEEGSEGESHGMYSYDPSNKEIVLLNNPITDFLCDSISEDCSLKFDGKYWYVCIDVGKDDSYQLAVFSENFEKLSETEVPSDLMISVDVLDNIIYLQLYSCVLKCSTEDVLSGNVHWEEAFKFEREIDKELERDYADN